MKFWISLSSFIFFTSASWATPLIQSKDDGQICEKLLGYDYLTAIQSDPHFKGVTTVSCEKDGAPNGPYSSFYPNGRLKSQGQMQADQLTGHWRRWHPNGRLESEGNWVNGAPDGHWVVFSSEGRKLEEGDFKSGIRYCGYRKWSKKGILLSEAKTGCVMIAPSSTLNVELGIGYSKLSIADTTSQNSVVLVSALNQRAQVTYTHLRHLFVSTQIVNESLNPAHPSESYHQKKTLIQNIKAGTYFSFFDVFRIKASATLISEYFLVSDLSANSVLAKYPLFGGSISLSSKLLQSSQIELLAIGEATLLKPTSFEGFRVQKGNAVNLGAEFYYLHSAKSKIGLKPHYQAQHHQTTFSEQKKVDVGLAFVYETRL